MGRGKNQTGSPLGGFCYGSGMRWRRAMEGRDSLGDNENATTHQGPILCQALVYTVSVLHNSPEHCV